MAKPNLADVETLLAKGEEFSLTDSQYRKKSGLSLPKDRNYLIKKSALSKLCAKYGFRIAVQEKQVEFVKEQ